MRKYDNYRSSAAASASAGGRSRCAVPPTSSRVHSLWSSTTRYRLCAKLWCYKHYNTTPYYRGGGMPGLSRRHSRRRFHMSWHPMCYTILPLGDLMLSCSEKQKMFELWSSIWIDNVTSLVKCFDKKC